MVKAPVSGKAPTKPAARKGSATRNPQHPKPAAPTDLVTPTTDAERGLLIAADGNGGFDARSLDDAQRVVRSSFLRDLLMGRIADKTIPEVGLRTVGLIFEEALDLSYLANRGEFLPPLWLDSAHFKSKAHFNYARLDMLSLEDAKADAGIDMYGIRIVGHAWFKRLVCSAGLSLFNAEIGGRLNLNGARLKSTIDADGCVTGTAFTADGAVIKGGIFFRPVGDQRFESEGDIVLLGVEIGGQLDLGGARLKGSVDTDGRITGHAIIADGAVIKGDVFCRPSGSHRFEAEGEVRLLGSQIGGQLSLKGARLRGRVEADGRVTGVALAADGANIKGGVFCLPTADHRFEVEGKVRLLGVEIGGQLDLSGARLKGAVEGDGRVTGDALSADGAVIKGDVFCRLWGNHRFEAEGEVRLLGSQIGGCLDLSGAHMKGAVDTGGRVVGDALSADGAVIKASVFCKLAEEHPFEAEGAVRLPGVEIGGQLVLSGAHLKGALSADGRVTDALHASGVKVLNATFLDDAFRSHGAVVLRGAKLGDLSLQGDFHGTASASIALDFRDAEIRRLFFDLNARSGNGRIHLEGASADTLDALNPEAWGPAPDDNGDGLELDLDGFTYRRAEVSMAPRPRTRKWARFFVRDPVAENVLDLLDRSFRGKSPCRDHYSPQPFEQAVKALRETGYSRAADEVAVAKREFHRQCGADGRLAAFMSSISLIFFRYGYGPLRASVWTIAFALLGAGLVWIGQDSNLLVATVEPGQTAKRCAEVPLSLALDTFLPLVDFGVEARCRVATGLPWSGVAEALRVSYAILGWLFIPMVALTFSGLLRRD